MGKSLNLLENDVHTSDKVIIERLKFQLELSQISNSRLEKTVENQKTLIENQKTVIESKEELIRTQHLMINFLNNWKFQDKKFQTDLKATCEN